MAEYITVKEFAKLVKVSPQSIYKRIRNENNPIQPFVKLVDGNKALVSTEAVSLYQKQEKSVEEEIKEKQETPASNSVNQDLIDMLRKELEEKSQQLKVKDQQIADLNDRLAESQQMLNQQQHLNAIAEQKVLALETKVEEAETKKSWWQIFK